MDTSIEGLNLVIAASGLLMCLLCLTQAYLDEHRERTSHRNLIILFTVLVAYILFNFGGQLVDDFQGYGFSMIQRVLLFFESLTAAAATPILLVLVLRSCGEKHWGRTAEFNLTIAILIVYLVMLVVNEFTGTFYFIDLENVYHRGPLYPILLIPPPRSSW